MYSLCLQNIRWKSFLQNSSHYIYTHVNIFIVSLVCVFSCKKKLGTMWKDLHLFNTTWAKHDQSCNLSGWICRQSARCMDRSCSGGPFVITSSLRTLSLASFGRSSGRAAASLGGPAPTWSQTCLRSTCSSQWKNKIKIKCSLQNSFFWCPTHIWAQNVQNEHFQVEELNQKCSLQNSFFWCPTHI